MCGISGIVFKNSKRDREGQIKALTDLIAHRGMDDYGYFFDDCLAFGHRRLSIIDLSINGKQPMSYAGRYTITYNGEIYNYKEVKKVLRDDGYCFRTETDTEIILAAYDKWGASCVTRFNGMWSFAIYDNQQKKIFCSRDRFGVKPYYYKTSEDYFVFGSEIKQFTALPDWKAVMNDKALYDYLSRGKTDFSMETFFKDVFQLLPGHNLTYCMQTHALSLSQWYDFPIEQRALSWEDASEQYGRLFEDSVRLRLNADVNVGSCLSGGLDSSSVVCMIDKILSQQDLSRHQSAVSSCFDDKRFDEQDYIDEVVRRSNIKSYKVFPHLADLFDELDQLVWHQDQPFGSTSIFAQWNVYRKAQQSGLKVMLDGQGADEYLAGYPIFYDAFFLGLFKKRKFSQLINEFHHTHKLNGYSWKKLLKVFIRGSSFIEPILMKRSNMTQNNMACLLPSFCGQSGNYDQLNVDFYAKNINNLSSACLQYSSLPMLLRYQDRNSMAFSVESREPFLDYRLVELVLTLPDDYKIRLGKSKALLRSSMRGVIPEKIYDRHDKMGFVTPEPVWMQKQANVIRSKLVDAAFSLSGYLDSNRLIEHFDRDLKRQKFAVGSAYWRIICLSSWLNVFNVQVN